MLLWRANAALKYFLHSVQRVMGTTHEGDVHGPCQLNVINESAFALQQRCQFVLHHNFLEINGTMCAAFFRLDLLSNPLLASFGLRQFQSWFH